MRFPSGKFVLRLPCESHLALKKLADSRNQSLNQLCCALLERELSVGSLKRDTLGSQLQELLNASHIEPISLILFGSVARGQKTAQSDTDILIVMEDTSPIERTLYQTWDAEVAVALACELSPHFVQLPSSLRTAGGLWNEVAIDGIILWEKDLRSRNLLNGLRELMATGKLIRKFSHGHPYWIRS